MRALLVGLLVFGAVACGQTETSTPQSCIRALNTAEQVFGISTRFAELTERISLAAADGVQAAGSFDIVGLEAATADVQQINTEMDGLNAELTPLVDQYNSASESCRSGGE